MYPLRYTGVFVPFLPVGFHLNDFVQAPVPFVVGVTSSNFATLEDLSGLVEVNLDCNTLHIPAPAKAQARLPNFHTMVGALSTVTKGVFKPAHVHKHIQHQRSRLQAFGADRATGSTATAAGSSATGRRASVGVLSAQGGPRFNNLRVQECFAHFFVTLVGDLVDDVKSDDFDATTYAAKHPELKVQMHAACMPPTSLLQRSLTVNRALW